MSFMAFYSFWIAYHPILVVLVAHEHLAVIADLAGKADSLLRHRVGFHGVLLHRVAGLGKGRKRYGQETHAQESAHNFPHESSFCRNLRQPSVCRTWDAPACEKFHWTAPAPGTVALR